MHGPCAICNRNESLTRHHLIPRTRHSNRRTKLRFPKEQLLKTVGVCAPCHKQIHALIPENDLEQNWNTVEKLREHPCLRTFVKWIRPKPTGFSCSSHGKWT
jgi:hypothetical protein